MSTERNIFDLDACTDDAVLLLAQAEEAEARPLLRLQLSVSQWERLKSLMLELRSSNVAVCVLFKAPPTGEAELSQELLTEVFAHLRMWDQFTLHNLLELCGSWFSPPILQALKQEARMEMKWFEEWSTAASDSRINKYPTLPWRRFIRKTTTENYQFFSQLLEIWGSESVDEEKKITDVVSAFLKEKRKAVNLFPKRWGKGKETH